MKLHTVNKIVDITKLIKIYMPRKYCLLKCEHGIHFRSWVKTNKFLPVITKTFDYVQFLRTVGKSNALVLVNTHVYHNVEKFEANIVNKRGALQYITTYTNSVNIIPSISLRFKFAHTFVIIMTVNKFKRLKKLERVFKQIITVTNK
jgi:hypothetical protein